MNDGWSDAALAAALIAVDPAGTGGAAVRALPGPVRDRWLALIRELLPPDIPVRRIPLHVSDGRLLGGLDLAATLAAGRPIAERGLLAEADGGVVVLSMAERLTPSTVARLAAAFDTQAVLVERDGLGLRTPTQFGMVALDEGMSDEERPHAALLDRLAFHLDLHAIGVNDAQASPFRLDTILSARARLPTVQAGDAIVEALCGTAMALGIASPRATILALRVGRAAAALAGRDAVTEADAALAGRLVFAARATLLPVPPPDKEDPDEGEEDKRQAPEPRYDPEHVRDEQADAVANTEQPLRDIVLAAAKAAIPPALLAQLQMAGGRPALRTRNAGRAGRAQISRVRGRPVGTRRGEPRAGVRISVIDTLRAAAPWQRLRRSDTAQPAEGAQGRVRMKIRREDFRVTRYQQRTRTTTIFVVDASGSTALHRLAEAKGAVELLLAESYVRRDEVALIAFRGVGAALLLPPTRSLVRAKRCLAGLPGGGGTPLAAGIDMAIALADSVRRKQGTPVIVLLTDGRANVAQDGSQGRARAEEEAVAAARRMRAAGLNALLVDTSPRPQPLAERFATEMNARYLPLPHADAVAVSRAARATVHQHAQST
ncbi:MAG: magnesium chelatase subunit D [Gammaproteobacteria bacterium]